MTSPRYQDIAGQRHHRDRRRRRDGGEDHHRQVLGQEGAGGRDRGGAALSRRDGAGGGAEDAAGRYAGERLRLCLRGRGAASAMRRRRRACGWRRSSAGEELNIRDLSGNRTLVRFGSGDEVTVAGGAGGGALPAGRRAAAEGAGGLAGADRDEHARGALIAGRWRRRARPARGGGRLASVKAAVGGLSRHAARFRGVRLAGSGRFRRAASPAVVTPAVVHAIGGAARWRRGRRGSGVRDLVGPDAEARA